MRVGVVASGSKRVGNRDDSDISSVAVALSKYAIRRNATNYATLGRNEMCGCCCFSR